MRVWRPYTQMQTAAAPLRAVRTEGTRIHLEDGRVLIDGTASWWTACHGYNHPHIRDCVRRQLDKMPHVMFGGLTHEPAENLAERLCALLPGDLGHVFFADSGSVAVEVAMKMAAQYWLNQGVRTRTSFLAFSGGYHGDTFATMAVCDPEEGMHALFGPLLQKNVILPLPRDEATAAALENFLEDHSESLAGMLVEPLVQGAGGMIFHAPEVLRRLRALADRYDLPLILDEIFTGFGRTGTMFACEAAGIVPDILTLSKALTGGTMALSAAIARPHLFEAFLSDRADNALMHGPTYMANPLACSAALASLDLFAAEPRLAQVAGVSAGLRAGLAPCRDLPGVRDVRVLGAIGVVELHRIDDVESLKAGPGGRGRVGAPVPQYRVSDPGADDRRRRTWPRYVPPSHAWCRDALSPRRRARYKAWTCGCGEMVTASGSKSDGGNPLPVRVWPPAPGAGHVSAP